MFNGIAPQYDRLNHMLSLGADRSWRKKSIDAVVCPGRPQRILDVACGTGDSSLAIAGAMHPESRVTAVDISQGMLEVMKRKLLKNNLTDKVTVIKADAQELPFVNGSFDCAYVAFGVRNFQDRRAALLEILRVLDAGGRLAVLELSLPESPILRRLYLFAFRTVAPAVGGLISGHRDAYRYLPASVSEFPGKEEFMAFLRHCGYSGVAHKAFSFGACRLYTAVKG